MNYNIQSNILRTLINYSFHIGYKRVNEKIMIYYLLLFITNLKSLSLHLSIHQNLSVCITIDIYIRKYYSLSHSKLIC